MNVKEIDYPEKFRPIIRRLQAASQAKEVRDIMNVEDDFLAEINEIENETVLERKLKEEERKLKEKALNRNSLAIKLLIQNGFSIVDIAKSMNLTNDEVELFAKK